MRHVRLRRAGLSGSRVSGASGPEQLDDVPAAAEQDPGADLEARLDELILEYRRGDDPR